MESNYIWVRFGLKFYFNTLNFTENWKIKFFIILVSSSRFFRYIEKLIENKYSLTENCQCLTKFQ